MKKYVAFFSVLAVFAASCEKTVTIDIPEKTPRLVLNSKLETGDSIGLLVFKTRHILSPPTPGSLRIYDEYAVKDAVAIVFENNVAVDTLVYFPSIYTYKSVKNTVVKPGIVYTYKVSANGFATAEASSKLPSQSVIAQVSRVRNVKTNSYGESMDEISIRLDDPAAEKNFYLVQVFQGWFSPVYCVSTTDKDIEQIGEDADPLSSDNCYDGSVLLLTDENFNGKQKLLKLFVDSIQLQETTQPSGGVMRPYVKVSRITEDYFKYLKSYENYRWSSDNPFAEPVNVFTNVKNGLGIFALSTAAVDTLR